MKEVPRSVGLAIAACDNKYLTLGQGLACRRLFCSVDVVSQNTTSTFHADRITSENTRNMNACKIQIQVLQFQDECNSARLGTYVLLAVHCDH
jgi:hypothetical protein